MMTDSLPGSVPSATIGLTSGGTPSWPARQEPCERKTSAQPRASPARNTYQSVFVGSNQLVNLFPTTPEMERGHCVHLVGRGKMIHLVHIHLQKLNIGMLRTQTRVDGLRTQRDVLHQSLCQQRVIAWNKRCLLTLICLHGPHHDAVQ